MDEALGRLLLLRMRGGIRYRFSQFASVRGALFLLIFVAIIWLLLDARSAAQLSGSVGLRENIRDFLPLGLLGAAIFTVFVSSGPALYFSPNEINFLFAGPFTRRGLVVYKFCAYFAGAFLSAAIITLLIPPRASTGTAAFVGALLTLLFIQLFSAAAGMCVQVFQRDWLVRLRRPAVLASIGSIAAAVLYGVAVTTDGTLIEVLVGFRRSIPGQILLAPFAVFAEILLARELFPNLLVWTALGLAINGLLLLVILQLDRKTVEQSLAESARLNNRWTRIKQGGSIWASDKTTGRSLTRAPVWAGIGPIAWRQAINAVRNSGRAILFFFVLALFTGPLVVNIGSKFTISGTIAMLYFAVAFVLPRTLVCDFRGELDKIGHYKALPISPRRICIGQMVVPVLLCSAIEIVMIGSALMFVDGAAARFLLALIVFTLPFNLLLYGVENLVFLLFPTKLVPVGRVDFDFLGRTLVEFLLKTVIVFSAVAAAAGLGIKVMHATGNSWLLFGLSVWAALSAIALFTIPLMGLAFDRFRLSQTIE